MQRQVSITPCPVIEAKVPTYRRDSLYSVNGDTTTSFDFTNEFRASFRNVKPRRRQTTFNKRDGSSLGFTIHEEEDAHIGLAQDGRTGIERQSIAPRRRDSILQPPQRPKHRVSFAPIDAPLQTESVNASIASSLIQAPRRPVLKQEVKRKYVPTVPEETTLKIPSPKISKPARRGTIFVPSDDTTMPSMYMGIFSPIRNLDIPEHNEETNPESDVTGIAAVMAKKKGMRRSMLATSPKRCPLQQSTRLSHSNVPDVIQHGTGPGKENVPPGYNKNQQSINEKQMFHRRTSSFQSSQRNEFEATQISKPRPASSFFAPTASSAARKTVPVMSSDSKTKSISIATTSIRQKPKVQVSQPVKPSQQIKTSSISENHISRKAPVPSRVVIPNVKAEDGIHQHPLLVEGVTDSTMYEDNWLAHQEIAIAQLVNNLFDASSSDPSPEIDYTSRRTQMLKLYNDSAISMLYKRAQGALLYGGLSLSQELLDKIPKLGKDVGKRRAFTDLWLNTYEIGTLQAALEVVIGRQCNANDHEQQLSYIPSSSTQNLTLRRSLQQFIEKFLVYNEDGQPDLGDSNRETWTYQRTFLRSLMLIKVLDLTRTSTETTFSKCLFQKTSSHKSSVTLLQALVHMLNPSAGDPTRVLNHIGYKVSHSQYPLEEYIYHIDNLAVDLRDGVCLTRLVELLLYPSASRTLSQIHDIDATTTVLLPTGETLNINGRDCDWPLSQHLKFPCLSRVTKLYNVQIALSAIQGIKGMDVVIQEIQAEDIVDGFREKTVKLLWGLTSKWGLGGLIDWNDVKREIKRLRRVEGFVGIDDMDLFDIVEDEEEPDHMKYKALLKLWARAVAGSRGIKVQNFTTAFSDGRVFAAVVDEYEPYLSDRRLCENGKSLDERLRSLGCSLQFAGLFSKSTTSTNTCHIFDRDFVLAALAFLCSRLMGSSKLARSAVSIQRAWRNHWLKVQRYRRAQLRLMAEACTRAVERKDQLIQAKSIIWKAWCSYRQQRRKSPLPVDLSNRPFNQMPTTSDEDIWLSL